ncbi:hypothetical protein CW304_28870 [Bacillus sp. UFRGS-B20]|nr:hypothetical protein CW304_28870 [Bacillus sp. UFRGS-B20]
MFPAAQRRQCSSHPCARSNSVVHHVVFIGLIKFAWSLSSSNHCSQMSEKCNRSLVCVFAVLCHFSLCCGSRDSIMQFNVMFHRFAP